MIIGAIVMPFTNLNSILGIRIQQTLDYPEVWRRTHIFTSLFLSFMILPTVIVIFYIESYSSFILCNIFLISPLIIGIIYAVIITIPIEKAEKEQLAKELEEQIKKRIRVSLEHNSSYTLIRKHFSYCKEYERLVIN